MKLFFRVRRFRENPAAGAVFGWLLLVLAGSCLGNLGWLSFSLLWPAQTTLGEVLAGAAGIILPFLAALYGLYLLLVFFWRQDLSRSHWIFWSLLTAPAVLFCLCVEFWPVWLAGLLCGISVIAGFNGACVRKPYFQWYIALLGCIIACLPGLSILVDLTFILDFDGRTATLPIPVVWRAPVVYTSLLFFIGGTFCMFKLWSSASGLRLRDVWGAGCNGLLIVFALLYIVLAALALEQQKKRDAVLTVLEERFQRKISADALKELYYRGRKTDEDFHIALENAWNDFAGKHDPVFSFIISEAGTLDHLPSRFRERFLSAEAEKFGAFFDAPLPARQRNYASGKLLGMTFPELMMMRRAANVFAWQVRIACESKDHARMMQAWNRYPWITGCLAHETSLIGALVLIAVEQIRLSSLESMLASRMLTGSELDEIRQQLGQAISRLPQLNRDALYFEAVMGHDAVWGIEEGTMTESAAFAGAEGLNHYRFLLPGFWYLETCASRTLLACYDAASLCKAESRIFFAPENILACMLIPALKRAGERMHELEMRYQAFIVLIEAEKIKRKTGAYPETLPLEVRDFFGGKSLRYRVGHTEKRETFLEKEKHPEGAMESGAYDTLASRTKNVQGVSVWSVGRDKVDDGGLYGTGKNGAQTTDDLRALLILLP